MKEISFDLLHKYNVQGPRYTSYPPAPSWSPEIGIKDYEQAIDRSNKANRPLSLYFHLPFCEKLCYFCGCTTLITGKNRSFEMPYLDSVHKEIDWLASQVAPKRPVVQFHLGGGTPTYSSPAELERLMERVRKGFSFDKNAEIGIEVDPRVTTVHHLEALARAGFNRLSMGVQDFEPAVQQAINRIQPFADTQFLVEAARRCGFTSINMDLIYGLPFQTPETFKHTVELVLSIGPDRLAVYSYAHVPWLKHHQEIFQKSLPSENQKYEIFMTALRMFTEAGFEYIGMDHFAKPTDELSKARTDRTLWRNFQGYTTKAGTDLLGLGMSAIGRVDDLFVQNQKEIHGYQEAVKANGAATHRGAKLTKDDRLRSRVIQNLLCHAVVVKSEIEKEFGIRFDTYFAESLKALEPLEKDGLVELSKDEIRPTEIGRIFLRNLAMPFDAYLPKDGDKKIFSRTV